MFVAPVTRVRSNLVSNISGTGIKHLGLVSGGDPAPPLAPGTCKRVIIPSAAEELCRLVSDKIYTTIILRPAFRKECYRPLLLLYRNRDGRVTARFYRCLSDGLLSAKITLAAGCPNIKRTVKTISLSIR